MIFGVYFKQNKRRHLVFFLKNFMWDFVESKILHFSRLWGGLLILLHAPLKISTFSIWTLALLLPLIPTFHVLFETRSRQFVRRILALSHIVLWVVRITPFCTRRRNAIFTIFIQFRCPHRFSSSQRVWHLWMHSSVCTQVLFGMCYVCQVKFWGGNAVWNTRIGMVVPLATSSSPTDQHECVVMAMEGERISIPVFDVWDNFLPHLGASLKCTLLHLRGSVCSVRTHKKCSRRIASGCDCTTVTRDVFCGYSMTPCICCILYMDRVKFTGRSCGDQATRILPC